MSRGAKRAVDGGCARGYNVVIQAGCEAPRGGAGTYTQEER